MTDLYRNVNTSDEINELNQLNVRNMINKKNTNCVFYGTTCDAESITTDYDHFPYTRWFRGKYNSEDPIIAEREAGFRRRNDACYKLVKCKAELDQKPRICFQYPAGTNFPCVACEENAYPCSLTPIYPVVLYR
jgi:hypothetical protein